VEGEEAKDRIVLKVYYQIKNIWTEKECQEMTVKNLSQRAVVLPLQDSVQEVKKVW